jgi:hypothetical protein
MRKPPIDLALPPEGDLSAEQARWLKELERENARLRAMVAGLWTALSSPKGRKETRVATKLFPHRKKPSPRESTAHA